MHSDKVTVSQTAENSSGSKPGAYGRRGPNPYDFESRLKLTESEKRVYKAVDRRREDDLVRKYVDTHDLSILEELFAMREPTLWVMAKKYAWLETPPDENDMFTLFKMAWRRSVEGYRYEAKLRAVRNKDGSIVKNIDGTIKMTVRRTQFNTYLFSSMLYAVRNLLKKRIRLRMLDDNGQSVLDTMLSLDYEYGEGDDSNNLHNILPSKRLGAHSPIDVDKIILEVCGDDCELKDAMRLFANESHIKKLSFACKLRRHVFHLDRSDYGIMKAGDEGSATRLKEMVKSSGKYQKPFKILSYAVYPGRVEFELYLEDTRVSRKLLRAIAASKHKLSRDFTSTRKNKEGKCAISAV